ncbi:putative DNA repair and recombination protein RAD26 [Paratrimastix pyriformis]|uniref:DNA repair and recombination protein RAD26 n=1 Tax=Paratrimastix pyriformis TaxID=342808 RepID=A0ABQ8UUF9_9EUKA|nr:putative DNA repair and recombination protein RAD26 [Paratrimastix pyriformis]
MDEVLDVQGVRAQEQTEYEAGILESAEAAMEAADRNALGKIQLELTKIELQFARVNSLPDPPVHSGNAMKAEEAVRAQGRISRAKTALKLKIKELKKQERVLQNSLKAREEKRTGAPASSPSPAEQRRSDEALADALFADALEGLRTQNTRDSILSGLPKSVLASSKTPSAARTPRAGSAASSASRKQPRPEVNGSDGEETEEDDFEKEGDLIEDEPAVEETDDGAALEDQDKLVAIDEENNPELRIPSVIWDRLLAFQRTGVRWLLELHQQNVGGILGDEMGLGKTVQICAFFSALRASHLWGPTLLACPATVMRQWSEESARWCPGLKCDILHTSAVQSRRKARIGESSDEDEDDESRDHPITDMKAASVRRLIARAIRHEHLVVTTFEGLRVHQDELLGQPWHYLILDEGQKIKNPDSALTLVCKQFATPHRLILSGAPIQNNLTELWSLFDFVYPGRLGTLPVFRAQFGVPITMGGYASASAFQVQTAFKCAMVLRDLVRPYLLRRLKSGVMAALPAKTEHVLFCQLTPSQHQIYTNFLKTPIVADILAGKVKVSYGALDTIRKICNHPDLCHLKDVERPPDFGDWRKSGKLRVVADVLALWHKNKHRVLLFSQTRQMLDIIEQFVESLNYTYLRMDGNTSIKQRQTLMTKYNKEESIFLFLLTTRVGGVGVNLTGADRVLIYDPDWNPCTDIQARERAWRLGQRRPVTIYRLLTSGTIEEKIYHRQVFKQYLTMRVLSDPRQRRFFQSKDLHDLFAAPPPLPTGIATDGSLNETERLFGPGLTADTAEVEKPTPTPSPTPPPPEDGELPDLDGELGELGKEGDRPSTPVFTERLASPQGAEASEPIPKDRPPSADPTPTATSTAAGDAPLVSPAPPPPPELLEVEHDELRRHGGIVGLEVAAEDAPTPSPSPNNGAQKHSTVVSDEEGDLLKALLGTGKRAGLVSAAMSHDAIMAQGDTSAVAPHLVEREASAIAHKAAQALRESVSKGGMGGGITWTGRSGTRGAPRKRPSRGGSSHLAGAPSTSRRAGRRSLDDGADDDDDELNRRAIERHRAAEALGFEVGGAHQEAQPPLPPIGSSPVPLNSPPPTAPRAAADPVLRAVRLSSIVTLRPAAHLVLPPPPSSALVPPPQPGGSPPLPTAVPLAPTPIPIPAAPAAAPRRFGSTINPRLGLLGYPAFQPILTAASSSSSSATTAVFSPFPPLPPAAPPATPSPPPPPTGSAPPIGSQLFAKLAQLQEFRSRTPTAATPRTPTPTPPQQRSPVPPTAGTPPSPAQPVATSGDLLQNMQHRQEPQDEGTPAPLLDPAQAQEMTSMMYKYLVDSGGRCMSEDLVRHFGGRFQGRTQVALFRSLIKEIATFRRIPGQGGCWELRPELVPDAHPGR